MSKIGYNAPSQANWVYSIYKVDLINTKDSYCRAHIFKSAFGAESEFKKAFKDGTIIETTSVYTSTGTPHITGIRSMLSIQSKEAIEIIKDFLTNK